MNVPKRVVVGISSTAIALGTGVGGATATSSRATGTSPSRSSRIGPPPGSPALASYLGLTSEQIRAALESGQTLAALATAQGKTVSGLEALIIADTTRHLDDAVAAGKLTVEQEASILADLQGHIAAVVNSTGAPSGGPGNGPATAAIASYLGLTSDEIRAELQSGKTLAAIAVAQGKTADGLEAAILADARSHLDAAVAAGKLTAAQEASILAGIRAHVAGRSTRRSSEGG